MYRSATIAVYDVMESVHIHAVVKMWWGFGVDSESTESTYSATVQGVGSSEDYIWLRDALVALLETL